MGKGPPGRWSGVVGLPLSPGRESPNPVIRCEQKQEEKPTTAVHPNALTTQTKTSGVNGPLRGSQKNPRMGSLRIPDLSNRLKKKAKPSNMGLSCD